VFATPRHALGRLGASVCTNNAAIENKMNMLVLVSKITPCMSLYKALHGETANGSLKPLSFLFGESE
jgi:hypothetical protein